MKDMRTVVGLGVILSLGGLSFSLYTKYKAQKQIADDYFHELPDGSADGVGLINVQRDVGRRGMGLINVNRTRRGMGSLQVPANDGLSNYMRVGLLQVSQRYRPRNGVEL